MISGDHDLFKEVHSCFKIMDREHKIFIAHHHEDHTVVHRYLIEPLTRQQHDGITIKCYIDADKDLGKARIESIADLVESCHHTFVFLTKTSLKKAWIKYETWLALQKSQRNWKLCLALILFDVDPSEVLDARFGLLTQSIIIPVDTNSKDYDKLMIKHVIQNIKKARPVEPTQIAASLFLGQVWSHFTGYARTVLPKLELCIKSSQWYQRYPHRFPVKEFNLIPKSAVSQVSLANFHEHINYVGDLQTIKADRGSFKNRPYRLSVYSIYDEDTNQKYFFVGQIPNTLSVLSKLEERKIKMSSNRNPGDQEAFVITEGERKLQVDQYYYTYNCIVNHSRNAECNNKVKFIRFDDEKDLYRLLLKSVKEECDSSPEGRVQSFSQCDDTSVCIFYEKESQKDMETAEEVKSYLQKVNIHVVDCGDSGRSMFEILKDQTCKAKWLVVVLSKESMEMEQSQLLMFKTRTFVHKSVMEQKVCVVPILDGIDKDCVPHDLFAVTCLHKRERNYKEILLNIIKCDNIHMEATLSAIDVHQGLAWAYVLNYLEVTLKDLQARLEDMREKTAGRRLYKKLFIVVPSSCTSKAVGALDKDEFGKLYDESFYQLSEIHYKTESVGGVMKRDYQLIPYALRTEFSDVVVAVEFPNAVLCLHEMNELCGLSGMSTDILHQEAWRFKVLCQNIIDSSPSVKNKAKLIYYDDSMRTVADAIRQVLSDEEDGMFL